MKVLITGVGGLLGHDLWALMRERHELIGLDRQQPVWVETPSYRNCDLTNAAMTYALITKENPEVVIHCAAYNQVDAAESDPDAAYRGNALATRNVALACQRFDATLIALSSDYVFDGETPRADGYREWDPCHPTSRYGESKWWAERYIQSLLSRYFIVRTSWLFGPSRQTWVDQIPQLARSRRPVVAVRDMTSSPTYTPDLADAIGRLAESRHYGIYHLTNQGSCTRLEFAETVLRLHQLEPSGTVQAVTRDQLQLPAPRPRYSVLENLVWRLDGFPAMRSWKDALREHIQTQKVKSS